MTDKAKDHIIGYAAGIAAGVSYGFNPLFAKPLLDDGVSVYSMLLSQVLFYSLPWAWQKVTC